MTRLTILTVLLLAVAVPCLAQPGYASQTMSGGLTYFTYPTYNGVEINEKSATIQQWIAELTDMLEIDATYVTTQYECVVPSQTNCSTYQVYNTAGFNNGFWEVHSCTYAGWTWDNCYNRPSAIVFADVIPNDESSWSGIKAMYR